MPRKAKAAGAAAAESAEAGEKERTFAAPSGKHYVIAQDSYPAELPAEIRAEVVTATEGDLLELLMTHMDVGYGRRFKAREGAVNEGVFRLCWVKGVRLVLADGERRPVEVEIDGPEFGFQQPRGSDAASKLRLKRYRKKLDDAVHFWQASGAGKAGTLAKQEAAASKAAAALEKADEAEKARKLKAQQLKQRREQQRQQEQEQRQQEQEQQQEEEQEEQQQQEQQEEQQQEEQLQSQVLQRRPEDRQKRQETDAESTPDREVELPPKKPVDERSEGECQSPAASGCSGSSPDVGSPKGSQGRTPVSLRTWDSRWEKRAAALEAALSASSSGVEDVEGGRQRRPSVQKKITTTKFTRTLLLAKRSGELQAIAEEWEKAHSEMASKASDLSAFKEKVKRGLDGARRADDVERIIEEMASEAERKALEVKELKERVFKAMIALKRPRNLERTTSDMDDAQKELEMRALQLKNLMKRAWKGMVESKKRTGELERIADEMSEDFQTKADSLKHKVRKGLLRAYRAGELQEIRHELDEIADTVPLDEGPGDPKSRSKEETSRTHLRRRWAEYSSDSDAVGGEQGVVSGTFHPERRRISSPAEADVSGSDADSSAGPGSPFRS